MAYKALKTFVGKISMRRGETREIKDEAIVNDLIKSGLVISLEDDKPAPVTADTQTVATEKPRKGRKKKEVI